MVVWTMLSKQELVRGVMRACKLAGMVRMKGRAFQKRQYETVVADFVASADVGDAEDAEKHMGTTVAAAAAVDTCDGPARLDPDTDGVLNQVQHAPAVDTGVAGVVGNGVVGAADVGSLVAGVDVAVFGTAVAPVASRLMIAE